MISVHGHNVKGKSAEQRFLDAIDKTDTCWIWLNYKDKKGYGKFSSNNKTVYVHRWSYENFIGPIPDGLVIDHLCRITSCVNPKHLEPVTTKENLYRGETHAAHNTAKTHCANGHEFSAENTRHKKTRGYIERVCKICHRARDKKRRDRNK